MATPWPHIVCGVLFFVCLFSQVFLLCDQKFSKTPRKQKTEKKTKLLTLWSLPTPWPHIVCGIVFCFLDVFWFLAKSSKNSRKHKNKKTQKTLDAMALYRLPLAPRSLWSFVFCFWTAKTSRKTKKISTLWPYGYPLTSHSLWSFVFVCLFVCLFSRIFFFGF